MSKYQISANYRYIENITKTDNLWYRHWYFEYHNIFIPSKTFDMLEISAISKDEKSRATDDPALIDKKKFLDSFTFFSLL